MYKKHDFTAEDFIRSWQQANGVEEVAKKFNINTTTASMYASRLRKLGVTNLKKHARGRKDKADVARLNKIAKECQVRSNGKAKTA